MGDTDTSQSVRGKGWVTFDDTGESQASTVSAASTPRRLSHSESDTPGSLEVSDACVIVVSGQSAMCIDMDLDMEGIGKCKSSVRGEW